MMAFIFFRKNLTSFKTPTHMVGCEFSGLVFSDFTDSQADSPGSIPVTRYQDRHPLPVTRSRLRRRPAARRQAGMTTKARASAGKWRGLFAPRGVGGGCALSRGALTGAAADARRLPPPRRPVVARRHVGLRHRGKPIRGPRRAGDHRAPTVHAAPSSAGTRRTPARSARFEPASFCKDEMTPLPGVLYSATLAGSDDPQRRQLDIRVILSSWRYHASACP